MKSKIKSLLASGLHGSGLLRAMQTIKQGRSADGDATILMYHRVVEDMNSELPHTQAGMMVTRSTFDRQMALLSQQYHVVSLSHLVDCLASGEKPRPRTVAITFDDGWRDNFTLAYPLLKKYEMPATIFLTTDFVGSNSTFWFHRIGLALATNQLSGNEIRYAVNLRCENSGEIIPPEFEASTGLSGSTNALDHFLEALKSLRGETIEKIADSLWERLPPGNQTLNQRWILNWDEVRVMAGGSIDFGSHGRSHRIATGISAAELEDELRESRETIASQVEQSADLLAYPNGNYDRDVVEAAKKSGYKGAVTTAFTRKDATLDRLYALRRIGIHEGMSVDKSGRFSESAFAFGISGWRDKLRGNL